MHSRPILRQYRGPAVASATPPATGGDNLGDFIIQVDILRQALGYTWSDLSTLCGEDSKTLDQRGLVKLIGQLGSIQRGQRHGN